MRLVHLTASTFFGGPERQMLGLAQALRPEHETRFFSFAESGRCRDFLQRAREQGFPAESLRHDTPHLPAAVRELTGKLREWQTDFLLCHGYKSNILGRIGARRAGVPVVAVSRGWTGENIKVRLYDLLDKIHLRFLDHVVAVSEGQARKVGRCGVPINRLTIIRNAARLSDCRAAEPESLQQLRSLFPSPGRCTVVSAGRLSREKGFGDFIESAKLICLANSEVRFAIFGEGRMRDELQRKIDEAGLNDKFVLPGFRDDLDRLLPGADVFVLPSYTEGLPNVILEASAAAVPVVATAVGGTPEVVRHSETGYLVPPRNPQALAEDISGLLGDESLRRSMGHAGREFVQKHFTFAAQAEAYRRLLAELRIANKTTQARERTAA
ncbi:MAG TPA: glycosyltransferase [Gemmataceae bacterium]|nr:glycosyltransferase [Gemmataceae bacterium]